MAGPELVSVVLPLRDARRHVADQLAALAGQTYQGAWELVVVDNGSTDGSLDVVRGYAAVIPAVRVADASARRGLNYARNQGVAAARGDFVVFCDADDVATPRWLEAMVAASSEADIVAGPLDFETLNDALTRSWRRGRVWSDQRLPNGFFEYIPGGNCGIWASVARELGWDEAFTYGSADTEFAWRAQLLRYRVVPATGAVMHVRYPCGLTGLARQFFRYGASQPRLFRRFRSRGMPRADRGEALGIWQGLVADLPDVWRSPERRGRWVRAAALRCGRAVGSIRHRVFFP